MKQILFLRAITGKEIESIYNDIAKSEDKNPVASNIFPIVDEKGTTDIFNAFIFYDVIEIKKKEALKIEL